ncbi:MAG: hypothetical protein MN733_14505 [Nitrososphaera sp.]|nr:hypothetical protein [Nitrososphaera sp.]
MALKRAINVIPILIDDTSMPGIADLPEPLKGLARHNGISVRSDPDFHRDMDRVVSELSRHLSLRKRPWIKVLSFCITVAVMLAVPFRKQLLSSFRGHTPSSAALRHLLSLDAGNTPAPYSPGTKVGGIVWNTNLIPFKIMIEAKEAIRDFDMKIMLDDGETGITDIGQITSFSGMTVVPTMELDWSTNSVTMDSSVLLEGIDEKGKTVSQIVELEKGQMSASIWRVHFDKLLPNSTATLLVAGVRPRPHSLPADKITKVNLRGSFVATKSNISTNFDTNLVFYVRERKSTTNP